MPRRTRTRRAASVHCQPMPFRAECLESRVLFAGGAFAEPLIAASVTPAQVINSIPNLRANLAARMTGAIATTLSGLTDPGEEGAFDTALLNHMRSVTTSRFFYGPGNVADAVAFVQANGLTGTATSRANELLTHLFPEQGTSATYTVQLPDNIDWDTAYHANPEFDDNLNRFDFWQKLGEAYQYSGNTDYVKEMVNQMADWSSEMPAPADPTLWATTGGVGWSLLNAALRAESWVWSYQLVISSGSWTKEANTLFVYKAWELGNFLGTISVTAGAGYELSSNRSLFHAKSQIVLGHVFSDFSAAAAWESNGRSLLFGAMDAQLYDDGSHVEQSPGYTANVVEDLLEAKWLDELNGVAWAGDRSTKLANAVESYRQMLHPNATRPAIGDTYRTVSVTMFTKAALILDLVTVKSSAVNDALASGRDENYTALVVDDATQFAVGDQIHLDTKTEMMLVTAVNVGANTLTVSRRYGGTNTAGWIDNLTVYNLGNQTVAKPRSRDVWLFGDDAMYPFMALPSTPPLTERGKTKALPDSGNYIFRSGSDSSARQIIFDAGPTGGAHGHFDLLNFELWGHGRPLISDPGAYIYDSSPERQYVVSTRAHNTISVAGANHAALEGKDNPGFDVDQYTVGASSVQITAHHHGYQYLSGRPVVSRSMWYDLDGTIVIVDWGESVTSQAFTQSFNLQTEGNTANVTGVQPDGSFKTKYASGGNVRIQPLARTGQTVVRGGLTFVTNSGTSGDYTDDAYRFTVNQSGTFVFFVTVISAYNGLTVPDTTAAILNPAATAGQTVQVQLTKDGVSQTINFAPPAFARPNAAASTNLGSANDVEWGSDGSLHLIYFDRVNRQLKYTMRDPSSGIWSIVETLATGLAAETYLSMALDSNNKPAVAYFDGVNGDLKFSSYKTGAWIGQTVDSAGSVGLYPALIFSRNNGPVISYYHRTKGDLRMAIQVPGGWSITGIDTAGDVGRFSSIQLDPNRPDASKFAIGYEDTTNGDYKYAVQGSFSGAETVANGYSLYRVDNLAIGGGYTSLAFYDSGTADTKRYKPAMSYYDAGNSAVKFAFTANGVAWASTVIASSGRVGLYTNLFIGSDNKANVFYFNKDLNAHYRAVRNVGSGSWAYTALGSGGREMHVARRSTGALAYTNLDESGPELDVTFLAS